MKTDPPRPRLSPQGLHRGGAGARDASRDERAVPASDAAPRSAPKTRLAIATFLDTDNLAEAVEELERAGFGRDQVCLIGLERTVERLLAVAAAKSATLLSDLIATSASAEPSLMQSSDGFVLVACGPQWQHIGSASGTDSGRIVVGGWMDPATSSELTRLIGAGACVLSVNSDTVDQQRRSARILLSHSSHRVQTHEFTPN